MTTWKAAVAPRTTNDTSSACIASLLPSSPGSIPPWLWP